MYQSGRANYAFKNCRAVDIYASIRVVTKDSDYRSKVPPPSVSVKNRSKVTEADVVEWESSMKSFLEELRVGESGPPSAVCLIVLLGCSNPPRWQESDGLGTIPGQ